MKNTLLLLAAVGATATASAQTFGKSNGSGQISITSGAGLTYTQDFNTLDDSTTTSTGGSTLPNGWYISEVGTSATSVNGKYRANNGASNSGDTYSFGANSSSTERSLGSLSSGSNSPNFGAKFVNNTGATITGATVTLTMEQWRVGDTANIQDTTLFSVSMTADSLDDTMATAAWMDIPAFMLTSAVNVGSGALDGNLPANQTPITGSLTGLSIPNGATLWVRWKDKNILGADDGLSIDDMSITFSAASAVNNIATNSLPLSLLGNGVSNDVKAAFTAPENGTYTLTVTDLAGRVVSSQEGAAAKGQMVVAPVANTTLASGLYLVRIAQGTFSGVAKLSVR